jgi:MFS family permease
VLVLSPGFRSNQACADIFKVVYTVGLALVADTVDSQDIGYYMGFALSAMSLGVLVGPFLGGMVFKLAGFYAVVSMMGVTALVDVVLRLVMIERPVGKKFSEAGKGNDTEHARLLQAVSREIEGPLTTAPALTVQNSQTFRLLLNPRVLAAIYGVFVHIGILSSFDAVLALFLEDVFGWTSLEVGICFLAIAIPCTVLGPLAGKLSDHYGSRLPAFAGFILTAVPMILFQLITHNSLAQIWLLYILLALSGRPARSLFILWQKP